MNCAQTDVWLLTALSPGDLPGRVDQHVRQCDRCRRQQQRLTRLNQVVTRTPLPRECRAAQERFRDRLATLLPPVESRPRKEEVDEAAIDPIPFPAPPEPRPPQEPSPRPVSKPKRRRVVAWKPPPPLVIGVAAAAVVLVALTVVIILWPRSGPGPDNGPLVKDPNAEADESLVAHLVQRDLRLAEAATAADQLDALSDMADDLRTETVRRAKDASADEVPLFAGLYERVVRQGWIGRARALPANQQADRFAALIKKLSDAEEEAKRAATSAAVGNRNALRLVRDVSQQARTTLETLPRGGAQGDLTPLPAIVEPGQILVAALVLDGVEMAESDNRVERAELCEDLAGHLLQMMAAASARGERDELLRLNKQLTQILERGVTANLAKLPGGMSDAQRRQAEEAVRRAAWIQQAVEGHNVRWIGPPPKGMSEEARRQQMKDMEKVLRDLSGGLKRFDKDWKPGSPWFRDNDRRGPPFGKPPDKKP